MGKKSTLFGPPPKEVITVGYIDPDKGFVEGVSINDANKYAKLNPGTVFLFLDGNKTLRYLNINEVNKLTAEDLSTKESCDTEPEPCGPPKLQFWGGGGIGAAANPVVVNGSILAIDLVRGGHGYKYPPFINVVDNCNIGSGAVIRTNLGITTTAVEVYNTEEDFEVYNVTADDVTYPVDWGDDGQDLGSWNPDDFTGEGEDPIAAQIAAYQKAVSSLSKPWWTTRKFAPKQITGGNKSYQKAYKVTFESSWSNFMNTYAISPTAPSNVPGTDFAGILFTFEWDANFPYDGDYTFRGLCDNVSKLYIDNVFITDLGGFNGQPQPFLKNVRKGLHKIRLDLLNAPIKQKVITQSQATTQLIQPPTPNQKPFKVTAVYSGVKNLVNNFKAGIYKVKVSYDQVTGPSGIAIEIKNKSNGKVVFDSLRNIGGSNIKLIPVTSGRYALNEFTKNSEESQIFLQKSGVLPDNVKNNSTTNIEWINVYFDEDGDYEISASADDQMVVEISITGSIPTQVTLPPPKSSSSTSSQNIQSKNVFNTVDYISKADRPLWRTNPTATAASSLIDRYGVSPFDVNAKLSQTESYAGIHPIRWQNINFPIDGFYKIQVAVDDNVVIYIGNRETSGSVDNGSGLRDINEGGDEVIIRKRGFSAAGVGTPDLNETRYFKAGNYRIRAELEQINVGPLAKGNPMALAINIETTFTEEEVISAKSWYQNPMGVALTIDAPEPPIPQEPPTKQIGRCPTNPIWSTRFPKSSQKWYPVKYSSEWWSRFMNRYAISPVPPLDTPGSDRAGVTFVNTWDIEIPYDGFYGVKGTVDDRGRILIDNEEVYKLRGFKNENPDTVKKYLKKGSHKIAVEVFNRPQTISTVINKKIFSTLDWQTLDSNQNQTTVDVDFNISISGLYANSFKIEDLGINLSKEYGVGKEISQKVVKKVEYGKVYTVKLASAQGRIQQRINGDKFLQVEDSDNPVNRFEDIQCLCSVGKFFGIEGDTCKFVVNLEKKSTTSGTTKNGVIYEGPNLYNYRHSAWGPFMNKYNVSPFEQTTNKTVNETVSIPGPSGIYLDLTEYDGQVQVQLQNVDNESNFFHAINIPGVGTVDENFSSETFTLAGGKLYGPCTPTHPSTTLYIGDERAEGISESGRRPNTQLVCEESGDDWNDFVISTDKGFFRRTNSTETITRTKIIPGDPITGEKTLIWKNVPFTESGQYLIKMQSDNIGTLYINNEKIYETTDFSGAEPIATLANISSGTYEVKVTLVNVPLPSPNRNDDFSINPAGVAIDITKDVTITSEASVSWTGGNPIGVSAVLIAPPCPKVTGGKGVVNEIIVDDPGNNYINQPESPDGYPVILTLDKVVVKDPGINYNCGVDTIRIVPDNGATLSYKCDSFGRIVEVNVVTPGSGYLGIPNIIMDTETGINFSAQAVLKPVREIIGFPEERLIQVTDLVGLKQTGYVDGRAYYGAVYYEGGLKYAGYFKTIGDPVRVYDTLQESITARVTTPPSAIERFGTDITSNDPTLNIPGTIRNVTNLE